MRAGLLAALLLVPGAAALDAFPTESHLGDVEARFLVRLPAGGELRVEAEGGVEVALAAPGEAPGPFAPAPAAFQVAEDQTWHGLSGVAQVVARRSSPEQEVHLVVRSGADGYAFDWPASARVRWVPGAEALAIVGVLVLVAGLRR